MIIYWAVFCLGWWVAALLFGTENEAGLVIVGALVTAISIVVLSIIVGKGVMALL